MLINLIYVSFCLLLRLLLLLLFLVLLLWHSSFLHRPSFFLIRYAVHCCTTFSADLTAFSNKNKEGNKMDDNKKKK